MNLDDMKTAWQQDNNEAPEVSLPQQKSLRQPLDIICNNMKNEMLMQLSSIILTFVLIIYLIKDPKFLFYSMALFTVTLSFTVYYAIRFKNLYQSIKTANYTSYQSLLELNYSLKYFKDLYIAYNLSFLPSLLCMYILGIEFFRGSSFLVNGGISTYLYIILSFIIAVTGVFFMMKFMFDTYYGKYIYNIAQLLKTIEQPYEDFDKSIIHADNGNALYRKTEKFFITKMGNFGGKLNFALWQILMVIIVIFCLKIAMEILLKV